jgi:hypothetical protein
VYVGSCLRACLDWYPLARIPSPDVEAWEPGLAVNGEEVEIS